MEAEAAKYIGAGIACLGMAGAAVGVGNLFSNYLSGALRNPSAAPITAVTLHQRAFSRPLIRPILRPRYSGSF